MSDMLAMVMAGGEGVRWGQPTPKCVAPILGEPVIGRTLRMLKARNVPAIVISHKPEVQAVVNGAEVYADRWPFYLDCAWALRDRWLPRNVVLFGDVAYTDFGLDALLKASGPMWWTGRCPEMFGMAWDERPDTREAIRAVVEAAPHVAGKRRGCCFNVYHQWVYDEPRHLAWVLVSTKRSYTHIADETSDMDTVEIWQGVSRAFERRSRG